MGIQNSQLCFRISDSQLPKGFFVPDFEVVLEDFQFMGQDKLGISFGIGGSAGLHHLEEGLMGQPHSFEFNGIFGRREPGSVRKEKGTMVRAQSRKMGDYRFHKRIQPICVREGSIQPGSHIGLTSSVFCPSKRIASIAQVF